MIHDPAVRREIESRLAALRPDSQRKWGSMTPDQMLWHLNQFLEFALGEGKYQPQKLPLPMPASPKTLLVNTTWPEPPA